MENERSNSQVGMFWIQAYGITWGLSAGVTDRNVPMAVKDLGSLLFLGGPTLAALSLTIFIGGKTELQKLLSGLGKWWVNGWGYLFSAIALTVLMSGVSNHTNGSILLAARFHTATNLRDWIVPLHPGITWEESVWASVLCGVLLWVTAVVVVQPYGVRDLKNKPKGNLRSNGIYPHKSSGKTGKIFRALVTQDRGLAEQLSHQACQSRGRIRLACSS